MDKTTVPIIVASITAAVTIVGWNISYLFAKRREDRTRRIESSIKQLDRQFEEFYGPLHSLIEQIFNVWRVRRTLTECIPQDKRDAVEIFVWKEYFLPLHSDIRELLKTKLYLAESGKIPESFRDYLEHSMQELFQKRLANELDVVIKDAKWKRWPQAFEKDVENAIDSIMKKRESLLRDLEPSTK